MKLTKENWIYTLALALPIISQLLRIKNNPYLPGMISYANLNQAYNPITLLINYLQLNTSIAARAFPYLFAILSFILFVKLLTQLSKNKDETYYAAIALALAPAFIKAATFTTLDSLKLLLLLSAVYYYKKNNWSQLLFIPLALLGPEDAIISIAALTTLSVFNKKTKPKYFLIITILIITLLQIKNITLTTPAKILDNFITDLGGNGTSMFAALLAFTGIIVIWENKTKYYSIYAILLGILALSLISPATAIYSTLLLAYLAGVAFNYLAKKQWVIKNITPMIILLLYCGLAFSAISTTIELSQSPPQKELAESAIMLKEQPHGKILVYSENKPLIEYYSKKPVETEKTITSGETILQSYYIRDVYEALKQNQIKYVIITPDMLGPIWINNQQGLQYMLTNQEHFKKIKENKQTKVYEVL